MKTAFSEAKTALLAATHLSFLEETAELCLATDASAVAIGAVLQQRASGQQEWRPLGFFSQKLEKAQMAYSAFDRELLPYMRPLDTSGIRWRGGISRSGPTIGR